MRITATLLAILAVSGCAGGFDDNRYQEHSTKTVSAAGVRSMRIENIAGQVRVIAWTQPAVRIVTTKKARDPQTLAATTIDIATSGDSLAIKTTGSDATANVDYTIDAPSTLALEVSNTAGTIRLDGFASDVKVGTQAGTVDVAMAKLGGSQRLDLRATTGTLALRIPKNSDATVDARSTIGSFDTAFPGLSTSRDNVVGQSGGGKIGNGSARVSLSTTTGTINLDAR